MAEPTNPAYLLSKIFELGCQLPLATIAKAAMTMVATATNTHIDQDRRNMIDSAPLTDGAIIQHECGYCNISV